MATQQQFTVIPVEELHPLAEVRKAEGWRYVQTHCSMASDDTVTYIVTFYKDGLLDNFEVRGVTKDVIVPSISDLFFSAFVFENEAHDLFGVNIDNIVIDFGGKFYDLAMAEPMTVISPAQKAAREKAAKVAAAKAAKEAGEKAPSAEDEEAAFEAKLAAMDPEKAAKVRAARAAKKAKEEEAAFEAKLAGMDPEKAAKVRAAREAKKAREAAAAQGEGE